MRRPTVLIGFLFTVLVATSAMAAPFGVLDQKNDAEEPGWQAFVGHGEWAGGYVESSQTFRVGLTGELTGVELILNPWIFSTSQPLYVEIRPTDVNGVPFADDAKTLKSIRAGAAQGAPAFTSIGFSNPKPRVTQGDLLAIVLRSSDSDGYRWKGGVGDPYPSGSSFYRKFSNSLRKGSWTPSKTQGFDLSFRTFVIPVPEPGDTLSLFFAIAALATITRPTTDKIRRSLPYCTVS